MYGLADHSQYISIKFQSDDPFTYTRPAPLTGVGKDTKGTLGSSAYHPGSFSQYSASSRLPTRTTSAPASSSQTSSYSSSQPSTPGHESPNTSATLYPTSTSHHPLISGVKFTPGFAGGSYLSQRYPNLEAVAHRARDPAMIMGTLNDMDVDARSRYGQGLGARRDIPLRQQVPVRNMVLPERILSGECLVTSVLKLQGPIHEPRSW